MEAFLAWKEGLEELAELAGEDWEPLVELEAFLVVVVM